MLPPSWKSEVQKTVEETANADRENREAQNNDAAAKIAAAIDTLSNAQQTQTSHEDRNEKINVGMAILTIFLVFLTVVFTGLSWLAFREQLAEMKKVYGPVSDQADAAKKAAEATVKAADAATKQSENSDKALIESQRAWVGPTNAKVDGAIEIGKPVTILTEYLNSGRGPAINFYLRNGQFCWHS
jgi:hypothetical protein